jgi:hypothetical protein
MVTKKQDPISDSEFRKDFEDSVFAEEMDFETVPAELLEAFGDSIFAEPTQPSNLIEDDLWGVEGLKEQHKR